MKFKIDENLPIELADEIRAFGHEAETVFAQALAGAPDERVIATTAAEDGVLVTMDKGIADVRRYPPAAFAGIVLLRPRRAGRFETIQFAKRHFPTLVTLELSGRLAVISESGIRLR
ncbi:MAG: DUF5615 family PIN-like protein [Chthoniobacterales bacterium]